MTKSYREADVNGIGQRIGTSVRYASASNVSVWHQQCVLPLSMRTQGMNLNSSGNWKSSLQSNFENHNPVIAAWVDERLYVH